MKSEYNTLYIHV